MLMMAAVTINCGGGGGSNSQSQGSIPPGPSEALWAQLPAGFNGLDVVAVADGVIISGDDNVGKVFVAKYSNGGTQQWLTRIADGSNPTFAVKNGLAVVYGEKVAIATNEPLNLGYSYSSNTGRVYIFSSHDGSILSRYLFDDKTIKALACDNGYVYTVSINPVVGLDSSHLIQRVGDSTFALSAVDCAVKTVRGAAVKDGYFYVLGDAYTYTVMYAVALDNKGGGMEYGFFNGISIPSARAITFDSMWVYIAVVWNGKYVVGVYPRLIADQPQLPTLPELPVKGTPSGIAVYDNVTIAICGDAPQSEVRMNGVTYRVYPGSGVALSPDKQYLFLVNGNGIFRFDAKTGNPAK